MPRLAVVAFALVAVALLAAEATAARRSGISGEVRTEGAAITMPATVIITRASSGRHVRTLHTASGRFHVRLRPGRYRLRATPDNGNGTAGATVRVRPHRFATVVLRLHGYVP